MRRNEKVGLFFILLGILLMLGGVQGVIYYHTLGGVFRAYQSDMENIRFFLFFIIFSGFVSFAAGGTRFFESSSSSSDDLDFDFQNLEELIHKKDERIAKLRERLKEVRNRGR